VDRVDHNSSEPRVKNCHHLELPRQCLFKKGAAFNIKGPSGTSPLQIAAPEGHLPAVKLLLNRVAQINQTDSCMGPAYLHLHPVAE
jgi:hypothetical protein